VEARNKIRTCSRTITSKKWTGTSASMRKK